MRSYVEQLKKLYPKAISYEKITVLYDAGKLTEQEYLYIVGQN